MSTIDSTPAPAPKKRRHRSDVPFVVVLSVIGGTYVVLILTMLLADTLYTSLGHVLRSLGKNEIRYATWLTVLSCTISAILSVWVAVPLGYLLSRYRFRGQALLEAILDIPIVLPPLVIGLSLLILFHLRIGGTCLEDVLQQRFHFSVTYSVPSVILAQFAVSCAFAVRTMRVVFDQISPRTEMVAMTLGCSRQQAFWLVILPQALRGTVTAFTLAWARALGEFGPIMVFAGATRMKTEVLSTTVFLEISVGDLESAVAVSLVMVTIAVIVLVIVRLLGSETARRG